MKKIYLAFTMILAVMLLPMQTFADNSKVTVKNANGEVSVSITEKASTEKIDVLLPGITECTEAVSHDFTVKSDADAIVSLRLSVAEKSATGEIPLNNYEITVKNANGDTVYDSSSAILSKPNDSYKKIELGEFRENDEKSFNITYRLIDSAMDVSGISLEIAAVENEMAAPKFDMDSLDEAEEFVFDFSEVFKDDDGSSTSAEAKEIVKVCGVDIPAGRFEVTGSGKLKITSATGAVKKEVAISATPENGKSVDESVILLESGDVIKITPLEGEEKARLKFGKVTATSPTATEKTGTALQAKATAAPKANPKTGDGGTIALMCVAVFAVLAVAVLEIMKRKSRKNG